MFKAGNSSEELVKNFFFLVFRKVLKLMWSFIVTVNVWEERGGGYIMALTHYLVCSD